MNARLPVDQEKGVLLGSTSHRRDFGNSAKNDGFANHFLRRDDHHDFHIEAIVEP